MKGKDDEKIDKEKKDKEKTRKGKKGQDNHKTRQSQQDKHKKHKNTRQDKTRRDKTRQDNTRQHKTRQDNARQDNTRQTQDKTRGTREENLPLISPKSLSTSLTLWRILSSCVCPGGSKTKDKTRPEKRVRMGKTLSFHQHPDPYQIPQKND